mmetsp:Transcript_17854/g.32372  ORF Transcript_17854/g.32372 Transcript_17854/m.32372 type:complete len:208 (-) Transcript_17854:177-800(-)
MLRFQTFGCMSLSNCGRASQPKPPLPVPIAMCIACAGSFSGLFTCRDLPSAPPPDTLSWKSRFRMKQSRTTDRMPSHPRSKSYDSRSSYLPSVLMRSCLSAASTDKTGVRNLATKFRLLPCSFIKCFTWAATIQFLSTQYPGSPFLVSSKSPATWIVRVPTCAYTSLSSMPVAVTASTRPGTCLIAVRPCVANPIIHERLTVNSSSA